MHRTATSIVLLIGIALFSAGVSPAVAQTVGWDPSPESTVAGYRLLYGTSSGSYTREIDVGNTTAYKPTDVDWSRHYYFAVKAYTKAGTTSKLSAELHWVPVGGGTPPPNPPPTPPPPKPPPPSTLTVTLQVNAASPFIMGKPVVWSATVSGATTAVEYRFWLFQRGAWRSMQAYGPTNRFVWTPTFSDQGGPQHVQVWVRAVGSTAEHEAWRASEPFFVTGTAFGLSADTDFPTPPKNPVTWTATVAETGTMKLEYKFFVFDPASKAWSVLREWARSNEAKWTPNAAGRYVVEAWARRVGSTADYEIQANQTADVGPSKLHLRLMSDTSFPTRVGTRVTFSARPRGGTFGPFEYQFWVYSGGTWRLSQGYSPNRIFMWTPTEEGLYAVQAWARSRGSSEPYQAWVGTEYFKVAGWPLQLTTDSLFPLAPESRINWAASMTEAPSRYEYQFWVYSQSTAEWALGKPYSIDPTFEWIPRATGTYAVQAWARQPGSARDYDAWRVTDFLQISRSPAQLRSLTSNQPLKKIAGTGITWIVTANGGSAPLEYQWWRWDNGEWHMVQDYSPSPFYTWFTSKADAGKHAIQVWVRGTGMSVSYEAYMSTGYFVVY